MRYLILEAFPDLSADIAAQYVMAIAGCWVAIDEAESAYAAARRGVESVGWTVVKVLENEVTTAQDYEVTGKNLEYFEQAQVDGEVYRFHTVPRELICPGDALPALARESMLADHSRFLNGTRASGRVWSLIQGDQWVNGVSPNGNEFLPMWPTEAGAKRWASYSEGAVTCSITLGELRDDLLLAVERSELLVALPTSVGDALWTHHPASLRADLLQGG